MGFKDYIKQKKESFDKYMDKRKSDKMEKVRTQNIQSKLDRESTILEAKQARKELKEIRQTNKARHDIDALKAAKAKERRPRSFMGKMEAGVSGLQKGIGDIGAANTRMFGSSSKGSNPFNSMLGSSSGGSDPFGGMFGESTAPRKRKSSSKKKGKRKRSKRVSSSDPFGLY